MSLSYLLLSFLGGIFWTLMLSVDGQSVNNSTTDGSYYSIIGYNLMFQCNITNVENPPMSSDTRAGHIRKWPEEYSKLDNHSWIGYVNCDKPNDTMSYIFSAQGNKSSAIVLYSNSNEPCDASSILSSNSSHNVSVPLFFGTNKTCQDTILNEAVGPSAFIMLFNNNISYQNGTDTTSPEDNGVIAATYQTAMVILYSVSGIVLGLFFIIVVVNIIRNRFRHQSQSTGENRDNPRNGITKSVLDSFPVYLFSLRNGVNKVSEVAKAGDVSSEPVLESLKVVDEKKMESTEETEVLDQTLSENKEKDIGVGTDESADDVTDVYKIPQTEDSPQPNRLTLLPSAISSVFNQVTDEQLTCPICLGDFESGEELRILPCHHQYHTVCIDPWLLDTSPLCPMCKTDYTSWEKELPSSHQEDVSVSLPSLYSSGVANDERSQSQSRINDNDSSQHIFPHFRWIRYLTAIRRAGGRRRNVRRAQLRHSEVGGEEMPGHQRPQGDDDGDDAAREQGSRHGIFRASV